MLFALGTVRFRSPLKSSITFSPSILETLEDLELEDTKFEQIAQPQ